MADTIVTNTPSDRGASGFIFAVVIIVVIAAGGFVLYQKGFFKGGASTTNINVSVPAPVIPTPVTP